MNFRPLQLAFGLLPVSLILSACGGGGSAQNPARGNYLGSFVNTEPNTDSGTLLFTVDPSGNIINGTITDTTNSANSGTFSGSLDSDDTAHLTIKIGTASYTVTGTRLFAVGSTTVFNYVLASNTGSGSFASHWNGVTKH